MLVHHADCKAPKGYEMRTFLFVRLKFMKKIKIFFLHLCDICFF